MEQQQQHKRLEQPLQCQTLCLTHGPGACVVRISGISPSQSCCDLSQAQSQLSLSNTALNTPFNHKRNLFSVNMIPASNLLPGHVSMEKPRYKPDALPEHPPKLTGCTARHRGWCPPPPQRHFSPSALPCKKLLGAELNPLRFSQLNDF